MSEPTWDWADVAAVGVMARTSRCAYTRKHVVSAYFGTHPGAHSPPWLPFENARKSTTAGIRYGWAEAVSEWEDAEKVMQLLDGGVRP